MVLPRWIGRAGILAVLAPVTAVLFSMPIGGLAQIPGLPQYTDPFDAPPDRSGSFMVTVGHSADDAGEEGLASWTLARRYRPSQGFTVTGTAGLHYPDPGDGQGRSARPHVGAAWDWIFLNEPDVIVTLHNGVGYRGARGGDVFAVPLGAGVTWFVPVVPTGAGPQIALWALPRGEYLQRSGDGVTADDLTWGASFGLSAVTSGGAGINLGGDYHRIPSGSDALPFVPEWSWALMVRVRG